MRRTGFFSRFCSWLSCNLAGAFKTCCSGVVFPCLVLTSLATSCRAQDFLWRTAREGTTDGTVFRTLTAGRYWMSCTYYQALVHADHESFGVVDGWKLVPSGAPLVGLDAIDYGPQWAINLTGGDWSEALWFECIDAGPSAWRAGSGGGDRLDWLRVYKTASGPVPTWKMSGGGGDVALAFRAYGVILGDDAITYSHPFVQSAAAGGMVVASDGFKIDFYYSPADYYQTTSPAGFHDQGATTGLVKYMTLEVQSGSAPGDERDITSLTTLLTNWYADWRAQRAEINGYLATIVSRLGGDGGREAAISMAGTTTLPGVDPGVTTDRVKDAAAVLPFEALSIADPGGPVMGETGWSMTIPMSGIPHMSDMTVSMDFTPVMSYISILHAVMLALVGTWGVARVWGELRRV